MRETLCHLLSTIEILLVSKQHRLVALGHQVSHAVFYFIRHKVVEELCICYVIHFKTEIKYLEPNILKNTKYMIHDPRQYNAY